MAITISWSLPIWYVFLSLRSGALSTLLNSRDLNISSLRCVRSGWSRYRRPRRLARHQLADGYYDRGLRPSNRFVFHLSSLPFPSSPAVWFPSLILSCLTRPMMIRSNRSSGQNRSCHHLPRTRRRRGLVRLPLPHSSSFRRSASLAHANIWFRCCCGGTGTISRTRLISLNDPSSTTSSLVIRPPSRGSPLPTSISGSEREERTRTRLMYLCRTRLSTD
jgi:hypothetical protein